jgi:cytoskeletal protein RodZ
MTLMRSSGARDRDAGVVGTLAGDDGRDSASAPDPEWVDVRPPAESLGQYLKRHRELRGINASELSRTTRISSGSIEALESDRFDELPGEVFVRGFLKAYAQAIGLLPAEVLARYTSSRRVVFVTPLPMQTPLQVARDEHGRRFGVAIAFVLLLILLSLALSIALRPRGRDMPSVLSRSSSSSAVDTRMMTV